MRTMAASRLPQSSAPERPSSSLFRVERGTLPLFLPRPGIIKDVIGTTLGKAAGTEMYHAVRLRFPHDKHLTAVLLAEETYAGIIIIMENVEPFISEPTFHCSDRL